MIQTNEFAKMRFALLTLLCCAVVTALSGEDALEKWGGPRGGAELSHGGNSIGNGDVGGIKVDTGGGDIGEIGVGGGESGCDPATCDAQVGYVDIRRGYMNTHILVHSSVGN